MRVGSSKKTFYALKVVPLSKKWITLKGWTFFYIKKSFLENCLKNLINNKNCNISHSLQSPKMNFPSFHSSTLKAIYNLFSFILILLFLMLQKWKKRTCTHTRVKSSCIDVCAMLFVIFFDVSLFNELLLAFRRNCRWRKLLYRERERERMGCEGEEIVFELLYIWLAGSATNLFMRWMAFIFIMRFIPLINISKSLLTFGQTPKIVKLFALWQAILNIFLTLMHKWKFD